MEIKEISERRWLVSDNQAHNILFYGVSGCGKSLAIEGYVEYEKKIHPTVEIQLLDSKGLGEATAKMWKPDERRSEDLYQIKALQKQKDTLESFENNVKCYAPFLPNELPKNKIPNNIQFFTLSLKDVLNRELLPFLLQVPKDSPVIDFMVNQGTLLKEDETIFHLLHNIYRLTRKHSVTIGKQIISKPSEESFWLPSKVSDIKLLSMLIQRFLPFRYSGLIQEHNCPFNLKVEDIVRDHENTHVFLNIWNHDQKMRDLVALFVLSKLATMPKEYLSKNTIVVLDELRIFCPRYYSSPHKEYVNGLLSDYLGWFRGRNISILSSTQVISAVAPNVAKAFSDYFISKVPATELDLISRIARLRSEEIEIIKDIPQNVFTIAGNMESSTVSGFKIKIPRHYHANKTFDYLSWFKRDFKERLVSPKLQIKEIMKRWKQIDKLFKNKSLESYEQQIQIAIKKQKEGEEQKEQKQIKEVEKKVIKNKKQEAKGKAIEMVKQNTPYREIQKKTGLSIGTISNLKKNLMKG